ncbi:type II secretion system protein M [Hyphomonas sp. WL0036]|uniref:type II secretion system protein GspM n=1 Tax=Hyphomonas sediminis TaxID=2866160 RepID=UPI001C7E3EE3|nr:type II secretion system protein GspM [Hyphomonas sediminis]MBY9067693.1 type II secretion system protein M [Hyphomonas sediminis]
MKNWWEGRTGREKVMVGAAGTLFAIAVIWQLVLQPAMMTLDQSKLNHERAAQTLARLDRIGSLIEQGEAISPHVTSAGSQDIAAAQSASLRMATEAGLAAVSAPISATSEFGVQFSDVSSPALFTWIEQVETALGVHVTSAKLQPNANGHLDASLKFRLDGVS